MSLTDLYFPFTFSVRSCASGLKPHEKDCHRTKAMILLLDNYDSFTYNLAQFLGQLGEKLEVHRNDQITLDQIAAKKPQRIVISPGPGTPVESGICVDVIRRFSGEIPILGVCLGHQAIGYAFGGKVVRAPEIMH